MARYNVSSDMSDRIRLAESARSEAIEAADALYAAGFRELSAEEAWQHADAAFDLAYNADPEEMLVWRTDSTAEYVAVPWVDDRDEARGWYVPAFADALRERLAAVVAVYAEA